MAPILPIKKKEKKNCSSGSNITSICSRGCLWYGGSPVGRACDLLRMSDGRMMTWDDMDYGYDVICEVA